MKSNSLMDRLSGKYITYVWLCILVLLSVLPFASRAVYIDEPQYLHVAEAAIERDWRFPQDTDWIFFGLKYMNMASQTHLPAAEYYLAALLKIFGRFDEFRFRLLYSVFPLLAVFSFYRLARRFTGNPVIVASLFAASPAFFVMSPTLMMDIPMLAFFMAGLSCYFEALEEGRRLWFCSLFFFLAIGTGYLMLGPVGGLLIWAIANRRPKKEWLTISAAPALLLVWLLILRVHFGSNPAADLLKYYITHSSPTQILLPLASFLGGVSIFPWLHFAFTDLPRKGFVACGSIVAAAFSTLFKSWPSYSYRLWFVFLAGSGIFFLALFIQRALRRSEREMPPGQTFLILWAVSILSLLIFLAEMMSARYVLLVLPPLFLLTFDRIGGRRWAIISLAATVILSFAIAFSDYQLVNSYPAWVSQHVVPLQRSGFRVWNATESGLRFYMEKAGSETLDAADLRPRAANLIVKQTSFDYGLASDLGSLLLNISSTTLTSAFPIRTFSLEARAGFHDSRFGIVPYLISRTPFDRIVIAEVSPFVKDLPEVVPPDFSSVPVWFPGGVLLKQVTPEMNFHLQIPQAIKVSYELEGMGSVAVFDNSIILSKRNSGPAVWKNFRIIPKDWPN